MDLELLRDIRSDSMIINNVILPNLNDKNVMS